MLPKKRRIAVTAFFATAMLVLQQSAVLADARTDGERGIESFRQGRLIESMELLEPSARGGYAPAQVTLAYILDFSERDEEAVHWYRQAAESNNASGIFGLGSMYAKGEGVERDPHKAGQLTRQAAQMEHLLAMRAYAYALQNGALGFERDLTAAVEWFLKAATAGDQVSMRRLQDAYRLGQLGLPVDPDQAAAWENKLKLNN
jgi:TPR repeat protein